MLVVSLKKILVIHKGLTTSWLGSCLWPFIHFDRPIICNTVKYIDQSDNSYKYSVCAWIWCI